MKSRAYDLTVEEQDAIIACGVDEELADAIGVYCLTVNGTPVYIGSSTDMFRRGTEHIRRALEAEPTAASSMAEALHGDMYALMSKAGRRGALQFHPLWIVSYKDNSVDGKEHNDRAYELALILEAAEVMMHSQTLFNMCFNPLRENLADKDSRNKQYRKLYAALGILKHDYPATWDDRLTFLTMVIQAEKCLKFWLNEDDLRLVTELGETMKQEPPANSGVFVSLDDIFKL